MDGRARTGVVVVKDVTLALLAWAFTGETASRLTGSSVGYPSATSFFIVVGIAVAYHAIVFGVGLMAARAIGGRVVDRKAAVLTGGHKSLLVALAVLAFTDANAVEPGFAALVALIMHFVQAAFATVVSKLWKLYARLERADVKDAVAVAVATGMASPSTFGAKADMSVKPMSPTSDSQVRHG